MLCAVVQATLRILQLNANHHGVQQANESPLLFKPAFADVAFCVPAHLSVIPSTHRLMFT